MKYAAAHIAIDKGNTGYTCFCKPPRSVIVSGLIVFSRFFLCRILPIRGRDWYCFESGSGASGRGSQSAHPGS